jgi:hypothetical protein
MGIAMPSIFSVSDESISQSPNVGGAPVVSVNDIETNNANKRTKMDIHANPFFSLIIWQPSC